MTPRYRILSTFRRENCRGHWIKWSRCECDCGVKFECVSGSLRSGATKSCGCLKKEASGARLKDYWKSRPKTPPKKRRRGAEVYREYRAAKVDMTFIEFLRMRKAA